MIPPVFHFRNRKWTPLTRTCLIASALVHISFTGFILTRFYWIPQGLTLLSLPFLSLGIASLWGFPRFLGVVSVCYAVLAFSLFTFAALIFGDRNGAHFIAMGLAFPLLINAIFLGYAHIKLRRTYLPISQGSESLAEAMVWTAGAVLLGFTVWILSPHFQEPAPARSGIAATPSLTGQLPSVASIAPPEDEQRILETSAGYPELSEYQKAFLDAVLRQSRLSATTDPTLSEPPPARRYLGAAFYSSEGDVYADTAKPSSLSCRSALLRVLLPQAISAWPKQSFFTFAGPMQGDRRFQSLGCREFPDDSHYYELDVSSRADSASWKPMATSYRVAIEVPRFWKDSTRWANGTLSQDSLLEKASVSFVVVSNPPLQYEFSSGLILQSASVVDTAPFAYTRLVAPGAAKPVWDPALRLISFQTEIQNVGATAFKSLTWTQQFEIPARNSPDTETVTFTPHRVVLGALSGDGGNIILVEGETRICSGDLPFKWPKDRVPVLGTEVLEPSPLILSDLDGDGEPEILLESRILGKRWIFMGKDGTRFEVVIRQPGALPPCC